MSYASPPTPWPPSTRRTACAQDSRTPEAGRLSPLLITHTTAPSNDVPTAFRSPSAAVLRSVRSPTQHRMGGCLTLRPVSPMNRFNSTSTMTSNIVLPSLPNFVEQHITAIFNAKTAEDFDNAFEACFSKHVSVTVNGKHISRDECKKQLQGEKTGETSAEVTFNNIVAVPAGDDQPIGTGVVGVSYKVTVFGRFFVFGARQSSSFTSSLNVVVAQDKSLPEPQSPPHVRGGATDTRRISVLNEVVLHQLNPIRPPTSIPTNSSA
ncbi:hypothetical protein A0H81_05157 [Grifola frondosa]|uniref:NTF2 domain-containing protein n=1 Tax=Grifola frondosa TaxID=5627 RepID=A0A1C7MC60_GRIFR|nr:hypothetical protein A0H81_05157 [Grifola frondosa]